MNRKFGSILSFLHHDAASFQLPWEIWFYLWNHPRFDAISFHFPVKRVPSLHSSLLEYRQLSTAHDQLVLSLCQPFPLVETLHSCYLDAAIHAIPLATTGCTVFLPVQVWFYLCIPPVVNLIILPNIQVLLWVPPSFIYRQWLFIGNWILYTLPSIHGSGTAPSTAPRLRNTAFYPLCNQYLPHNWDNATDFNTKRAAMFTACTFFTKETWLLSSALFEAHALSSTVVSTKSLHQLLHVLIQTFWSKSSTFTPKAFLPIAHFSCDATIEQTQKFYPQRQKTQPLHPSGWTHALVFLTFSAMSHGDCGSEPSHQSRSLFMMHRTTFSSRAEFSMTGRAKKRNPSAIFLEHSIGSVFGSETYTLLWSPSNKWHKDCTMSLVSFVSWEIWCHHLNFNPSHPVWWLKPNFSKFSPIPITMA